MRRLLPRLVALLVIPCLVLDPATASAYAPATMPSSPILSLDSAHSVSFETQALGPATLTGRFYILIKRGVLPLEEQLKQAPEVILSEKIAILPKSTRTLDLTGTPLEPTVDAHAPSSARSRALIDLAYKRFGIPKSKPLSGWNGFVQEHYWNHPGPLAEWDRVRLDQAVLQEEVIGQLEQEHPAALQQLGLKLRSRFHLLLLDSPLDIPLQRQFSVAIAYWAPEAIKHMLAERASDHAITQGYIRSWVQALAVPDETLLADIEDAMRTVIQRYVERHSGVTPQRIDPETSNDDGTGPELSPDLLSTPTNPLALHRFGFDIKRFLFELNTQPIPEKDLERARAIYGEPISKDHGLSHSSKLTGITLMAIPPFFTRVRLWWRSRMFLFRLFHEMPSLQGKLRPIPFNKIHLTFAFRETKGKPVSTKRILQALRQIERFAPMDVVVTQENVFRQECIGVLEVDPQTNETLNALDTLQATALDALYPEEEYLPSELPNRNRFLREKKALRRLFHFTIWSMDIRPTKVELKAILGAVQESSNVPIPVHIETVSLVLTGGTQADPVLKTFRLRGHPATKSSPGIPAMMPEGEAAAYYKQAVLGRDAAHEAGLDGAEVLALMKMRHAVINLAPDEDVALLQGRLELVARFAVFQALGLPQQTDLSLIQLLLRQDEKVFFSKHAVRRMDEHGVLRPTGEVLVNGTWVPYEEAQHLPHFQTVFGDLKTLLVEFAQAPHFSETALEDERQRLQTRLSLERDPLRPSATLEESIEAFVGKVTTYVHTIARAHFVQWNTTHYYHGLTPDGELLEIPVAMMGPPSSADDDDALESVSETPHLESDRIQLSMSLVAPLKNARFMTLDKKLAEEEARHARLQRQYEQASPWEKGNLEGWVGAGELTLPPLRAFIKNSQVMTTEHLQAWLDTLFRELTGRSQIEPIVFEQTNPDDYVQLSHYYDWLAIALWDRGIAVEVAPDGSHLLYRDAKGIDPLDHAMWVTVRPFIMDWMFAGKADPVIKQILESINLEDSREARSDFQFLMNLVILMDPRFPTHQENIRAVLAAMKADPRLNQSPLQPEIEDAIARVGEGTVALDGPDLQSEIESIQHPIARLLKLILVAGQRNDALRAAYENLSRTLRQIEPAGGFQMGDRGISYKDFFSKVRTGSRLDLPGGDPLTHWRRKYVNGEEPYPLTLLAPYERVIIPVPGAEDITDMQYVEQPDLVHVINALSNPGILKQTLSHIFTMLHVTRGYPDGKDIYDESLQRLIVLCNVLYHALTTEPTTKDRVIQKQLHTAA